MKLGITMEELEKIRKEEAYEDGHSAGFKEGIRETARNFKTDGISVEVIARNTGLTPEEIEKL